jgi:thiamine transporter 2/3
MEIWLKLSILLCVFGFVKEFRPSEPFITPYLTGEWKNFTDQVISDGMHLE